MKEVLALAGGARRRLSAREEELLGLLASIPDGGDGSDRELSFSDLIDAGAGASSGPPPSADDLGVGAPATTPREDDRSPTAASAATAKRQQAARQRARRSGGGSRRGSCGGDGVLLNFYVPGLLTRSMTTPRPGRGPAIHSAPAKPVTTAAAAVAVAGKASRTQTALGIGCWPALWGRGRRPAKACS